MKYLTRRKTDDKFDSGTPRCPPHPPTHVRPPPPKTQNQFPYYKTTVTTGALNIQRDGDGYPFGIIRVENSFFRFFGRRFQNGPFIWLCVLTGNLWNVRNFFREATQFSIEHRLRFYFDTNQLLRTRKFLKMILVVPAKRIPFCKQIKNTNKNKMWTVIVGDDSAEQGRIYWRRVLCTRTDFRIGSV